VSRSSSRVPRERESWDDGREGSPGVQRRQARSGVGETKPHRHHIFPECDVPFDDFEYETLRVTVRRKQSSDSTAQYRMIVEISVLEAYRRNE
jgi:hypothetical protein